MTATNREVNVLLVIDKSGSMADKPAGFSTDKWSALKTALSSSLDAVKNSLSFGLELYPLSADPQNPIPVNCSSVPNDGGAPRAADAAPRYQRARGSGDDERSRDCLGARRHASRRRHPHG